MFPMLGVTVPKRHVSQARLSVPDRSSIPCLGNFVSYGFILPASIKLVVSLPGHRDLLLRPLIIVSRNTATDRLSAVCRFAPRACNIIADFMYVPASSIYHIL